MYEVSNTLSSSSSLTRILFTSHPYHGFSGLSRTLVSISTMSKHFYCELPGNPIVMKSYSNSLTYYLKISEREKLASFRPRPNFPKSESEDLSCVGSDEAIRIASKVLQRSFL